MLKRKNKLLKKIKNYFIKHRVKIFILFFIISLVVITNKIYNKYINSPKNIVKNIYFEKKIIENKDLQDTNKFITSILSGTNTAKEKILKFNSKKEKILKKYKYIKDLKIDIISSNELKVDYLFKKAKIVFMLSGNRYLVYDENNIYKFNNLLSGMYDNNTAIIYLPNYITDNKLKLIFWKNNIDKITKYYNNIKNIFKKAKIKYLAGGEILEIRLKDKKVWISLEKDIQKQLNKYLLIRKKVKNNFKFIDLGNIENKAFIK